MTERRIVAASVLLAVGLLGCLLLERITYYGFRSQLGVYLVQQGDTLGWSKQQRYELYDMFTMVATFSVLVGGALGATLGARVPLLVGTIVSTAGYALVATTGVEQAFLTLSVLAVGVGTAKVGLYALIAALMNRAGDSARNAAFCAAYVAINVGATAGIWVVSALVGGVSVPVHTSLLAVAGVSAVLLVLVTFILIVQALLAPVSDDFPVRSPQVGGTAILFAVLLVLSMVSAVIVPDPMLSGPETQQGFMIQVGTVVVGSFLLSAGFIVAAALRARLPELFIVGGGLVLLSGAGFLLSTGIVGFVLYGLGEAAVGLLLLSRMTGSVSSRLASVYVALYFVVSGTTHALAPIVLHMFAPIQTIMLVVGGLVGVVCFILAQPVDRLFTPAARED